MIPPTSRVSKPANRATPWSSWTTWSPTRRSLNASRPRPAPGARSAARLRRWTRRRKGKTASFQLGADEPLAQPRLGESEARVRREHAAVEDRSVDAVEPVAGALGLAAAVEGDDRAVSGADEFLQLGLGLLDVARRRLGPRGAERVLAIVAGARNREQGAGGERPGYVDVEMAGVIGVHRGRHVVPVVAQGRLDLLGGGEDHGRLLRDEVERRPELVDRQDLGEARRLDSLLGRLHRRQLGELAMLDVELGRGGELDPLGLAERALGESREPAHRVDLVAEQLDPDGALLGRPEDVEDAAADRELAPLLDLLDPLVSRGGEVLGDRAEVDLVAAGYGEPGGTERGVGDRLGEGHGAGDDDRVAAIAEGVEGVDPQPDEVRGRGHVRGVAGSARGVEADAARRQVGARGRRRGRGPSGRRR